MHIEMSTGAVRPDSTPNNTTGATVNSEENVTADIINFDRISETIKAYNNFHADYIKVSEPQASPEETINTSVPKIQSSEIIKTSETSIPAHLVEGKENSSPYVKNMRILPSKDGTELSPTAPPSIQTIADNVPISPNQISETPSIASGVIPHDVETIKLVEGKITTSINEFNLQSTTTEDEQIISRTGSPTSDKAQSQIVADKAEATESKTIEYKPSIESKVVFKDETLKPQDKLISLPDEKPLQIALLNNAAEKGPALALANVTTPNVSLKAAPSIQTLTALPTTHSAVQTVAQNLIRAQETQKGISIRLDPPEMGRVFIDFQFDADKNVTAIIRSELAETGQVLRDKSEFFQQVLKESGFDSVNLSFEQNKNEADKSFDFEEKDAPKLFGLGESLDDEAQVRAPSLINQYKILTNSKIDMKL